MGCVWRENIITTRRLELYSHQRNNRYKNVLLKLPMFSVACQQGYASGWMQSIHDTLKQGQVHHFITSNPHTAYGSHSLQSQ